MVEARTALAGCRVWVTRPRAQADALCELIRVAGGEAVKFPLVEIGAPPDTAAARESLADAGSGYACIFVSRNSVRCALELAPALSSRLGSCMVFAVGAGTAAELAGHAITAATGPGPAYGAADLLTLPALQAGAVRGRGVLIVRGVEGEPTLVDTLSARGARIRVAEVYRRIPPAIDTVATGTLWHTVPPDIMVLTSAGAAGTLVELTPAARRAQLLATPLAVISERVAAAVRDAGFTGPVRVAAGATDNELLEALLAWRTNS